MPYICMNCKKELDDFYTLSTLEKVKNNSSIECHTHIERKVPIFELRRQKIVVLCSKCNEETGIFTPDELEEIREYKKLLKDDKDRKKEIPIGFKKYTIKN